MDIDGHEFTAMLVALRGYLSLSGLQDNVIYKHAYMLIMLMWSRYNVYNVHHH